jgi:nucleoside-diphosphate-sugar epimerase
MKIINNLNFSKFFIISRKIKIIIFILIDCALCCLSIWIAYYLRLGNIFSPIEWMVFPMLTSVGISLSVFWFFDIYKNVSRNFNYFNILRLLQAITLYGIFFFLIIVVLSFKNVPRTIALIQPILYFFLLFIVRSFLEYLFNYQKNLSKKNTILIYGAGNAGLQLLKSLKKTNLYVEGFLDDDSQLIGMVIEGKKIYQTDDIEKLIIKKNVNQVLLAIPSLSRSGRNKIIEKISKYNIAVKALPTLSDLAEGLIQLSDVQEVNAEDLLGREQVRSFEHLMKINVFNKVVLVSGAGGSIGSEISRQVLKLNPKKIILFENSEFALYKINMYLNNFKKKNKKLENIQIISLLGSITDENLVELTISQWKPDIVFHSAAYKHIKLVEKNIIESIKNNFFGTVNILKSSISNKISNFVLISTDKAVKPINLMGATKRLAEMYIQALKKFNDYNLSSNLTIVRFGNVLDSSGSVIPIFKNQIKSGGPLTLSDYNVTRYFMTIPEASSLVIQASAMKKKDEIFVLDMGKPVKILDLAHKMISLSGLTIKDDLNPFGDIEIVIKGLEPGEKLHEDLLIGKGIESTEHPKIFKVREPFIELKELEKKIDQLKVLIEQREEKKIINFFNELSDEFDL